MASIFKRGNVWWIKYAVGGKRVTKSLETDCERQARESKKKIEALCVMNQLALPSSTPTTLALEAFCRHLKATGTRDGYKNDLSRLRGFFGPCCDALKLGSRVPIKFRKEPTKEAIVGRQPGVDAPVRFLENINSLMISTHLNERVAEGEIKPKTANDYREIIQRFFNFAIEHLGYVSPDHRYRHPVEGVKRFKESAPEITWLTSEAIEAQLLVVAADPVIHAAVATSIFAGPRRTEVVWLRDEDVDLKRRMIAIRAKTVEGVFWEPKTKRNRAIPISTRLESILREYLKTRSSGVGWFFPSPHGVRWDSDNYSQALSAINQKAGLSWSSLDFRHTFGSHLAQRGISLYKIATLMGNSPEICRRHYAALVPDAMHDDVEFAGSLSPSVPGKTDKPQLRLVGG